MPNLNNSSNGKGSKQRPFSVPYETYADNFDSIFRKEKYIVVPQEKENGDITIQIPDKLINNLGWKEGDQITLEKTPQGIRAKKKS